MQKVKVLGEQISYGKYIGNNNQKILVSFLVKISESI